jgi:CheY-like chemotaxis protein
VFKPDVVLCDLGMPGMDGYEVARCLHADAGLRGTRLVALTGFGQPEDLRRSAEAGFARHVVKPASLETLQQVIESTQAP